MTDKTTLSGTIPGLLRRGSPIVCTHDYWAGDEVVAAGTRGTVVALDPLEAVWDGEESTGGLLDADRADVALDLTDPTGRVHAAWEDKIGLRHKGAGE